MVREGNLSKPTKIPGTNLARWRGDDIERLIDGWFAEPEEVAEPSSGPD